MEKNAYSFSGIAAEMKNVKVSPLKWTDIIIKILE